MTPKRCSSAGVAALAVALLMAGCSASDPQATNTPEPSPSSESAASSASPSTTASVPPLPKTGWGDGTYAVPCFPGVPTVTFKAGKATYRGFQVTARVVARGVLASSESVSIHVVCSGASSSPSSVLVYIGAVDGPQYVGLALSPREVIDLKKAQYVDTELVLTGYGFTRRAPMCCPDLLVTKSVSLTDDKLVTTGMTQEPLKN